jgi:Mrp family chromosome partitioning ATPase
MFKRDKPKKVVLSLSGKGGVGKTLIASNVAISLSKKFKTGLLDADVKSPNVTSVLGISKEKFDHNHDKYRRIIPLDYNGLKVFSAATLFPDLHGITIPGEQQRGFLRQAVNDVKWGKLEYLVVDMDPSSGDSLLTMREIFKKIQAIVVSTADVASLNDCHRIIHACIIHKIPITGVVANMVDSECPYCNHVIICKNCNEIISFGDPGKVSKLAEKFDIPFLGAIRFNPDIKTRNDVGNPLLPTNEVIDNIIRRIK